MKIELKLGTPLEVGDFIRVENCFYTRNYRITRVTKRFAFCGGLKFQRVVDCNMSCPHDTWSMNRYTCYRECDHEE